MLMVFEVYFVPGTDPEALLSAEAKKETQAKVMTFAEAAKVGFAGLPAPASGNGEARLIAISKRDAAWINRILETSESVAGFRVHEVDA